MTVVHRHTSEMMGCVSLYTQLLAIVRTIRHLQPTFNELMLLRCDALLNAGQFLSRVSTPTRDIDITILCVCLSVTFEYSIEMA